jgi:tetratricopeptide (TPR) repeat protein
MLSFVLFCALLFQSSKLLEIQSLIDHNQLAEAEAGARAFVAAEPDSADGHYLLGYILFRRGDPRASLAEYTEGAKHREPDALDLAAMGSDAFLMEDYAAADRWLTQAAQKDAGNANTWYELGRARYNEKHFAEAAQALEESVKLEAANAKAQDFLGLAYEHLGKTEEALAAYRAGIALGTGGVGLNLDLGTLLVESGRAEEALGPLARAIAMAPQDAEAHRELGKAYLALNRLAEAQAQVEKAAELAPENAPVHFLLAQVYRKRGMTAKAGAQTARYAALTGAHSAPETPLAEARSLLDLGKLHEAESAVRGYLQLHAQSGEGHFLLGYVLFKQQNATASLAEYTEGAKYRKPSAADLEVVASDYVLLKDYPDADKWFSKAVEWNPQDALGWYYLGRTKYNENRFEEAVSAFQKCLALKPKDVKAEDNLGLSYEGLNQVEEALAAYRTAIAWQESAAVKDAGPYLNLGSLLVDSGKASEAIADLKEAVALAPGDFRMHRALGKAYAHLNQETEARQELEKAVTLAPGDAPVHFMLAQVYRKLGMTTEAKLETERYSKLTGAGSAPEK